MQALTLLPGQPGSLRLEELAEPPGQGPVLVRTLAVGVCATDRELIDGQYGEAPPGRRSLVLGHESLGRVAEAPAGSGLAVGDTVVGIVRHPDPVPCGNCALGEWDMCRNGKYTGLGGRRHLASLDVAALNQSLVMENRVVFGSVNANRRHYEAAARALARADGAWLEGILSRRVPLGRFREAYARREGDVKTVLLLED